MTDQLPDKSNFDTDNLQEIEASVEVGGPVVDRTESEPARPARECLVEEEYTVGVPLVRPRPEFLSILKQAGAVGEIFTKKEICEHLKNYIGARQLYDIDDPKVVYCGSDPLGKVFNVNKFEATIDQITRFLSSHCTPVPDTCLKRKRHLVSRPLPLHPPRTGLNQSTSFSIAVCRASPTVTSSSDIFTHDLKRRKTVPSATSDKQRKSSSSSAGSSRKNEKSTVNQSSLVLSTTEAHQSESGGGHSQDGSQLEVSKSAVGGQVVQKKSRNRKRRRRSGKEAGSSPSQASEPSSEPGPSRRKRGTSLSITYNDTNDLSYPWYFQLQMQDDAEEEESEVLSIQDKTTATVQDSTDDLWFVEEESFAVEVNSDGEFSVEYDVESEKSQLSESDISSIKSGQGVLVVCKESDVEFFADYSASESEDTDITDADKWMCQECNHINSPLQRYCDMCWKLRAGWLPDIPSSATRKMENQSDFGAKSINRDKTGSQVDDHAKTDSSSKIFQEIKSATAESADFDSGISCLSSSFPSSQETVIGGLSSSFPSSQETNQETHMSAIQRSGEKVSDKDICRDRMVTVSKEASLFHEAKESEVRYSFSNFQRTNSSSIESLESQTSDKNAFSVKSSSSVMDPCMICLSKPKSASLVHGSSGHQVCCFPCAKRLKRRGKVCPVCRRPIQKVIKNYIL